MDLFKPIFAPNIEDKKLVQAGKIFGTVLGLVSIFVAPYIADAPNGLFEFMKKFMGFFNVPTLVIVFVGFFSKKIPAVAAKIAIFVFMFLYGIFQFVYKVNISFLHLLGGLFILCVIIMAVIGYIAPMKTPYKQSEVEEVSSCSMEICETNLCTYCYNYNICIHSSFSAWNCWNTK